MIQKRTALILGAGASHDYGFPLGSSLRKEILKLGETGNYVAQKTHLEFHEQLEDFVFAFQQSHLYSIDAFLGVNPRFTEIGKLAIAAVLSQYEANSSADLLVGHRQTWYDYLWNKLASGHSLEELSFANLSIVTFNYDRSLETFLLSAMVGTFNVTQAQALEKLRELKIVHVYGEIGSPWPDDPQYVPYGDGFNPHSIKNTAAGLRVIPEARDDDPAFAKAKILLHDAAAICFLGFGFDSLNLKRLDSRNTCTASPRTDNAVRSRFIAGSCLGRTRAESIADAKACGLNAAYLQGPRPLNFIDGDCLQTLRETLILG